LTHYREYCNNSMVLRSIISSFQPDFFSANTTAMLTLIVEAQPSKHSLTHTFTTLGQRLLIAPPPEAQRISVLNEVWKVVSKCKPEELVVYTKAAAVWIEMLLKHYSNKEVNILLRDVVKHLDDGDSTQDEVLQWLEQIITLTVEHASSLEQIVTSDNFMKLMDHFKSRRKTEICKNLLESFGKRSDKTNDPIMIHTVFDIARNLHDTVDSMTNDGESRYISTLICNFLEKIDFGQDLEQQLNVFVDCRAAFPNLDGVKDRLVLAVCKLAMKAHQLMNGKHTKKTSAFVKACMAFCHITIPSIDNVFTRLNLLLLCGNTSLTNQCLPQTDTFFKAAITLIPEVPPLLDTFDYQRKESSEPQLLAFLTTFAGALVCVPGHPEHGPFYLVHGLLTAVQRYNWKAESGNKTKLYVVLLSLLCSYSQRKLPYSVAGVEANDLLYGGNAEYTKELRGHINTIVDEIMGQLTEIGQNNKNLQANLIVKLVNVSLTDAQLDNKTIQLVGKLCQLGAKNKPPAGETHTYFKNTINFIRKKADDARKARGSTQQGIGYQTLARGLAEL